jgi:cytochrome c
MKKSIFTFALVVLLTTCFTALVWAQGATKKEVVAKCMAAAKLIQEKGVKVASQEIGDKHGPFVWKDSYVFLMDLDGKMLAHPIKPALTKKATLVDVKDTEGKPLFMEFIEVAGKKGSGWVNYMWPKPGQEKPVAKTSYIYRVPNTPYFVGAGIYQ